MVLPEAFVQLEKAELHAHLNGCVPAVVVQSLVEQHQIELPDGYVLPNDLFIVSPVETLYDYFRPWGVFKRLPVGQACLEVMLDGAADALANDGVSYVELRNSPFNIAEINTISLERCLEWLVEAADKASVNHNIDIRLIISLSRFKFDLNKSESLLLAINAIEHRNRIVGFDLSGDEDQPIDPRVSELFRKARDEYGLGVTIHAGETGSIENVQWAVNSCKAHRIGHCLSASNDPKTLELLATENVCIEVCLTSNLLTKRCQSLEMHPVHKFIEHGVPFVLCTDNPQVHNVSLSQEYERFLLCTGNRDIISGMFEMQRKYAFAH